MTARDEADQATAGAPPPGGGVEDRVARIGGVTYLHIAARDPRQSAAFYQAVFDWSLGGDPDRPSFADGTGHVIGRWVTNLDVVGEAGVVPYVYVARIDDTITKIIAQGGDVVTPPYPEGDLWVATCHDPAGNVVGIWQQGPRA